MTPYVVFLRITTAKTTYWVTLPQSNANHAEVVVQR